MSKLLKKQISSAFFLGLLFSVSAAQAEPVSWTQLSNKFYSTIVSERGLKPNLQQNIEHFFATRFDRDNRQLVYIERPLASVDTVLDFITFSCSGIISRFADDEYTARSVEHLMYQTIRRLDTLSYEELCIVVDGAMSGRFNVFSTLAKKKLFGARDRLFYFLIEMATQKFEHQSHKRTAWTFSLRELMKQAIGRGPVREQVELELAKLSQPLAQNWEQILFIPNFFERAIKRKVREDFLRKALKIVDDL